MSDDEEIISLQRVYDALKDHDGPTRTRIVCWAQAKINDEEWKKLEAVEQEQPA